MREEKVTLGITTLLSMSILMLMVKNKKKTSKLILFKILNQVSDEMPTTSTFSKFFAFNYVYFNFYLKYL